MPMFCTSSNSTSFHGMATRAQFSHSPTHDKIMISMYDKRILQNCIYFIITKTVAYLWNTPQKHVLSHVYPNMLKIVTSAGYQCSCIYVPSIVFMCKAPSSSTLKCSNCGLRKSSCMYKHKSYIPLKSAFIGYSHPMTNKALW